MTDWDERDARDRREYLWAEKVATVRAHIESMEWITREDLKAVLNELLDLIDDAGKPD